MDASSSDPIIVPEAPSEPLLLIPPPTRPGGALALAQTIIDAGVAIELRPRDIALLVLIRQRIQTRSDGAISLTEGEIRGLARRIDELDISDPAGSEKRVTESLTRLMRAECLTRADIRPDFLPLLEACFRIFGRSAIFTDERYAAKWHAKRAKAVADAVANPEIKVQLSRLRQYRPAMEWLMPEVKHGIAATLAQLDAP